MDERDENELSGDLCSNKKEVYSTTPNHCVTFYVSNIKVRAVEMALFVAFMNKAIEEGFVNLSSELF